MINIVHENDTIVALATGKGNAALAILRISGEKAIDTVAQCLKQKHRFIASAPKTIHVYTFLNDTNKKEIDEITAIKYLSPQSYTGENMVEIMCHGGEVIVDELLSVLIKKEIRFAKKGEFTRRAFLNGKMNLLKAEAIQQLIEGTNTRHVALAREQYSGNSKKKLLEWKSKILNSIVEIEALIEFPEDDDIHESIPTYTQNLKSIHTILQKEIQNREFFNIHNKGILIPIVGITNAGKSSLFNVIVEFDRVIVHHEEGTTRDAVSEEILVHGETIKLIDTAGLNATENQVELLGIKKTWEFIEDGDIILLVTPADKKITDAELSIIQNKKNKIAIISKNDLNATLEKAEIFKKGAIPYIEANFRSEIDRPKIIEFLGTAIHKTYTITLDSEAILCNKRHEELARRIQKKLETILETDMKIGIEIIAYELKRVIADFDEFLGETSNEDVINAIFSEFCIGK